MAITTTLPAIAVRAGSAQAQTPPATAEFAEARTHFERGVMLFDRGDPSGALAEFLRAWELSHRAGMLFNIAAAYQALHRYPDAIDALRQFLSTEGSSSRQRSEAERVLAELSSLVARLHITTDPSNAAVTVDGRPIPFGQDIVVVGPGTHTVAATRAGLEPARGDLVVASGDTREVRLQLESLSPHDPTVLEHRSATLRLVGVPPTAVIVDGISRVASAPVEVSSGVHTVSVAVAGATSWQGELILSPGSDRTLQVRLASRTPDSGRSWFWACAAGAAALAVTAAILGGMAIETHADFAGRTATDPMIGGLASRGRTLAVAADVTGLGALAAAGVSVFLFSRAPPSSAVSRVELTMAPRPGGGSIAAHWRF